MPATTTNIPYPGTFIKKGSSEELSIKAIKQRLNALGFGPLDTNNGNFGDSTLSAVKKFQEANQLLADGIIGQLTWERLFTTSIYTIPSGLSLKQRAAEIADTQLYVRELTGHNDGKEVELYLKSVGLWKGLSWCAAFVYWCYEQASKNMGVPNPVIKTGGVLDHWGRTKGQRVYTPLPYDIFIMDYGKGMGHTGIVEEVKGSKIYTVEGNTNGKSVREGNGVYERIRDKSTIKGYIRY